jgi:hypothetical protein
MFYVFSSTKSDNRRVEQVLGWGWGGMAVVGGKVVGKGVVWRVDSEKPMRTECKQGNMWLNCFYL